MNFLRKITLPGVRVKGQQSQIWQFFSFFLFARKNESILRGERALQSRSTGRAPKLAEFRKIATFSPFSRQLKFELLMSRT